MNLQFIDFDIYSKQIGLFYKNKEKMSTPFGKLLSVIYFITSLSLFVTYIIDIIKRKKLNVHDSSTYPSKAPSIDLNKNIFYFAFGVESPIERTRFIDNTIYYPRAHFFYKVKEGSNLKTIKKEELKVERCEEAKFGKEYQNLLVSGELNNSYCLNDINFTLTGGLKYDKISYILIGIYPCVNKTENQNHCKPQEIIDEYLSGSYFSFLAKDVGLNPSNYLNPIVPTFQDFFTTIDKSFFRDYILYFGITEIQTDEGIFYEKITSKRVLQIRKEAKAFYFRDESKYYNGESMCDIQFRLGDDIRIQKRSYNKISAVFATIGGYMQLISTIFTIITFLTNRLEYEIKLANSLFNFYPKDKKISIKSKFTNLLESIEDVNNIKYNSSYNKADILHNFDKSIKLYNQNKNDNNSLKDKDNIIKNSNKKIYIISPKKLEINKNIEIKKNKNSNLNNKDSCIEESKFSNNKSKASFLINNLDDYSSSNIDNRFNIIKKSKYKIENGKIEKNIQIPDNYIAEKININICIYSCFSKCIKDKTKIKLFNDGISFYRQKLDIIHLFNIILLIETLSSKENININNK